MENRITISICDEEYTFVAEEAPSYMQKVGSYVNDKMSELLDAAKVGRTDAAVLTAVNIAVDIIIPMIVTIVLTGFFFMLFNVTLLNIFNFLSSRPS